MYALGGATAFTGFAVAADANGLFRQLGLAGPVISALNLLVGLLLVVWLVAFGYALLVITLRRLGRAALPEPVGRPPIAPVRFARSDHR